MYKTSRLLITEAEAQHTRVKTGKKKKKKKKAFPHFT